MPPIIDLTAITWQQFAVIAAVVSAVDLVTGIIYAIAPPNVFSWSLAATFLDTHVLKRVVPLAGLAAIAQSIPPSVTHDGLWAFAVAGLGLYVAETVKSISDNRALSTLDVTSGFIPSDPPAPPDVVQLVPLEPIAGDLSPVGVQLSTAPVPATDPPHIDDASGVH